MVVTWWIMAFLPSGVYQTQNFTVTRYTIATNIHKCTDFTRSYGEIFHGVPFSFTFKITCKQ